MARTNYKNLKKNQRLLWPTILVAIIFSGFVISVFSVGIKYIISNMVENKLKVVSDNAYRIELMIEQNLKAGKSLYKAISIYDGSEFYSDETQIYITDKEGKSISSIGPFYPDVFAPESITPLNNYVIYPDKNNQSAEDDTIGSLKELKLTDIIYRSFAPKQEEHAFSSEWHKEEVWCSNVWIRLDDISDEFVVYSRSSIVYTRQEFLFVSLISLVALVTLMIPLLFSVVNSILFTVRQRYLKKIIYTDLITQGHNWIWFEDHVNRYLKKHIFERVFFKNVNRLNKKIGKNNVGKQTVAMIDLHLSKYKHYCAYCGVKEGEDLLRRIDEFLQARYKEKVVFARHSNSDFAILMKCDGESVAQCKKECYAKMRALLAELTGLPSQQKLHFVAGVYLIEQFRTKRQLDIKECYHYANYALEKQYLDKKTTEQIFFFNEELLQDQVWIQFVENNMETALREEQFLVYIQPKYRPRDRRLVGAEALVRWCSPEIGMVPPGRFIPIFEENGFITKLDDYMISHVAKLQANWTLKKCKQVPISVNLSRAHFSQDDLPGHICRLVDSYGPRHELIEIEVTESAFFEDKETLIETVKSLKKLGFTVSMDDFGAGYSSLNSLKDIPLDILKLDGDFFKGDDLDGRGEIVIREAIRLAKRLNMKVVAEGIEKKSQVDLLTEIGCDMIQGFYYAKPMPVEQYEKIVEKDA